ncbi:MAG: hypothetical protein BroJett005_31490 [Ignavibacteriota bacterium]|nr:MAG: hypothetical protein BroJett005_31490 [Ignavibacteriota bacterium]
MCRVDSTEVHGRDPHFTGAWWVRIALRFSWGAVLAVGTLPAMGQGGSASGQSSTVAAGQSPEDRERDAGVRNDQTATPEVPGPLVTDRPDFTESTKTVAPRWFQLEGGYTFTYDREGGERRHEHAAPELLLRAGLAERVELRLGWAGYAWTELHEDVARGGGRARGREDWSQGAADVSFGLKVKLVDQAGLRPDFGVIVQATAPSGSPGYSSGDVDPEVKLLWAYELTERFSLAGNVNLGVPTEEAHRFVQSSASVSLGMSVAERIGAYAEYFGFYPNAHGSDCAHYLNGGLTFLITEDLQLDVRAGLGLNEEADDFFTGVGFAWRFGT